MSVTFAAAVFTGTYYDPTVTGGPEMNVSNVNAGRLLELLGYTHEDDYYGGVCPAEDFLGRILTATALLDVATDDAHGIPTVESDEPGMRVIDCGTAPGYLADRLENLREIAAWAQERGYTVVWA